MILVFESSRPEIDETDFRVQKDFAVFRGSVALFSGGWDAAVVCEGLIRVADQQNIFRLEIRVYKVQVVKD